MPDTELQPVVSDGPGHLQPVTEEDAPQVIDQRPKVVTVEDSINTDAQVVDGRVRVSDDISDQAVEQGYAPDIQPRAAAPAVAMQTGVADSFGGAVSGVLPDTTAGQVQGLVAAGKEDEAQAILDHAEAARAALDVIQAPLSVKAEIAAAQADGVAEDVAEPDVADQVSNPSTPPTSGGPTTNPDATATTSPSPTTPTGPLGSPIPPAGDGS